MPVEARPLPDHFDSETPAGCGPRALLRPVGLPRTSRFPRRMTYGATCYALCLFAVGLPLGRDRRPSAAARTKWQTEPPRGWLGRS